MAQNLNKPRTLLFAFMNGSYKKIDSVKYDHKEWIIVEKADGTKSFINSANVKWIDEIAAPKETGKDVDSPLPGAWITVK
jgi:hypothetical protein